MIRVENKNAQAAIELAVFGAILIFVLGTIVRSALGNAYTQNDGFKAMRMAMLASWQGTQPPNPRGKGVEANTTHNSASILIVEDRLSPDFNKYGPLDRTPYINQGSGTFTYNLYYPWQPGQDNPTNLVSIMDVWVNGQHFPFTTASYVTNRTIERPTCGSGSFSASYPLSQAQCLQNQCLRNAREWAGGIVNASQFDNIISVGSFNAGTNAAMVANGQAIFHALIIAGVVGTSGPYSSASSGYVVTGFSSMPSPFSITDPATNQTVALTQQEISGIQSILQGDVYAYKLFYTHEVNGTTQFVTSPPASCTGPDNALCSSLTVTDAFGNPYTNSTEDMQYDLLRNGDYNSGSSTAVETQFPVGGQMRNYIAWQWAASAATTAKSIGLDLSSNQYPTYDIDGRLKEVTIYGISQNPDGSPSVTYEDYQGGDIDSTWDINSCSPKPGLENETQIYTFTQQGTYLEIKEGGLYNPETDQFVRSVSKKDTIDIIQRTIQLSNNTGDFCNGSSPQGSVNNSPDPNPVEVCVAAGSGDNCFTSANVARTCFDQNDNRIFVRSRLLDQHGHYWMTDVSGQLQVQ